MLIDRKTGAVKLGAGAIIAPQMTRRQFEESGLMDLARAPMLNPPSARFHLNPLPFADRWVHTLIYFQKQRLNQLSLSFTDSEHGSSWETWGLEEQVQSKEFQEELLRVDLGQPHKTRTGAASIPDDRLRVEVTYRFPWGEVYSSFDERASAVSLTIRFKRPWYVFW